jgi:protein involved in polysaccharide export with SLBB domain
MNLFRKVLIISALFLFAFNGFAQNGSMNVANMTNEQLMQMVSQYQLTGLTGPELEAKAKEKGLSNDQIQALKARMAALNQGNLGLKSSSNFNDPYTQRKKIGIKSGLYKEEDSLSLNTLKVFGADIFEEEFLNFEPNLSIPSPKNYIIGANDQIIVDVFGVSERTQKLNVNTEGFIRFPNLGPIKVAGLTLEDAQQKIKIALSKIYPTIGSGKTQVNVSVGDIRSIRVTIIGEVKRPGSYSLSSLSTLMNALYTSGGPNTIGSFRNIYLMRNGKELVKFDLYDFLLKGDLSKNKLLMDEDVIRVAPYTNRVALKGAIKKQALYDVEDKDHLGDILKFAGGFADMGHKDFVRVKRVGDKNKEMLTAKSNQFDSFNLISGDTILVDTIASSYANRVHIQGSVYYPGEYGLNEVPTLKDLLLLAQIK